MPAGPRVARRTIIICSPIAAEVQFFKLRAITVPLKHHCLGPVMPNRSGNDDVRTNKDIGALVGIQIMAGLPHDWKSPGSGIAVNAPIATGEVQVTAFVESFVHGQSARVGMVSPKDTPGGRREELRELRARAAVVHQGGKDSGFEAPGKGRVV